jgi:hypothetical protein
MSIITGIRYLTGSLVNIGSVSAFFYVGLALLIIGIFSTIIANVMYGE